MELKGMSILRMNVDDDTFLWMRENVKQFIIRNVYAYLYIIGRRTEMREKGQATISKTIVQLV
jgi:hypothetical protein